MLNKPINSKDNIKYDYLDDFKNNPEPVITWETKEDYFASADEFCRMLAEDKEYQELLDALCKQFGY